MNGDCIGRLMEAEDEHGGIITHIIRKTDAAEEGIFSKRNPTGIDVRDERSDAYPYFQK